MTIYRGDPAPPAPADKTEKGRPRLLSTRRSRGFGDTAFRLLCQSATFVVIGLALALVVVLIWKAWLCMETTGWAFFTGKTWDAEPTHRIFGAKAFIYGTVVTSAIAMLVAVPLGVGTAAFLSELAPGWLRRSGSFFVEMLAAIPSVVYGFWGLAVLAPALERMISSLGGPNQAGTGMLPAGLVLGLMIIPYAAAVSFDVIRAVPRSQREAALALGATRWQMIWSAVLPYARPGIIGGCFLALGRALGETMAVTMLIGNRPDIPDFSRPIGEIVSQIVFGKGNSIPSVIANEFTEAGYDLYLSALVELGLVLLLVSVGFSALGRILIFRMSRPPSGWLKLSRLVRLGRLSRTDGKATDLSPEAAETPNDRPPRIPAGGRRAKWMDRLMSGGGPGGLRAGLLGVVAIAAVCITISFSVNDPALRMPLIFGFCAIGGIWVIATMGVLGLCQIATTVPLFLILGYLLYEGVHALNWDFFTKLPVPVGEKGGGLANAFYGSALMIGLATAFSVPLGLLAAIYLAEYRSGRLGAAVRFIGEMLGSVPSIVIGIFGYYAVVRPITTNFSGLAGGFALGVMMLPIVMRASEEALKLVPTSLRHASYALAASQWQTIVRVSVPAALPAIITAIFLGIARVGGETAPLLLTAVNNDFWPRSLNDYTPSLPVFIFQYANQPWEESKRLAWAAAFVLVSAIMVLNVGIRLLSGKRVLLASQAD